MSKRNFRLFRALLHFLVLAVAVGPASAQVYKWVDERGVTHYGERPPQGGKASEVPDRLGSPGGTPPRANPQATDRESRPAPLREEKSDDARRRDQCDTQRELLARLRQNLADGGGRVTLENSDAIARQEKLVTDRCKGL